MCTEQEPVEAGKKTSTFLRQTVDRLSTLHVMDNSTAQQLLEITVRLDAGGGGGRGERVEVRGERVEGRVYVPQTDCRQTEHVTCDGQLHSSTVTGDHCQVRRGGGGGERGESGSERGESGRESLRSSDRLSTD